jgi:hypothetical protein
MPGSSKIKHTLLFYLKKKKNPGPKCLWYCTILSVTSHWKNTNGKKTEHTLIIFKLSNSVICIYLWNFKLTNIESFLNQEISIFDILVSHKLVSIYTWMFVYDFSTCIFPRALFMSLNVSTMANIKFIKNCITINIMLCLLMECANGMRNKGRRYRLYMFDVFTIDPPRFGWWNVTYLADDRFIHLRH